MQTLRHGLPVGVDREVPPVDETFVGAGARLAEHPQDGVVEALRGFEVGDADVHVVEHATYSTRLPPSGTPRAGRGPRGRSASRSRRASSRPCSLGGLRVGQHDRLQHVVARLALQASARSGPIGTLVPAGSKAWQEPQPCARNTCLPRSVPAAGAEVATAARWRRSGRRSLRRRRRRSSSPPPRRRGRRRRGWWLSRRLRMVWPAGRRATAAARRPRQQRQAGDSHSSEGPPSSPVVVAGGGRAACRARRSGSP